MEVENDRVAEKNYLDLLDMSTELGEEEDNQLFQWVRPIHLDDEVGNPDPRIAAHAREFGVNVEHSGGDILMLGDKPHQSLTNLSKTYGPVMSLKLGSISTIVISSPETAKEVLHRNDQAFSGREVLIPCFTIYYIRIGVSNGQAGPTALYDQDLFLAGTDTTSDTIEWAMAELLHNPEKMVKAQRELQEVLGKDGIVQESDISKLPYLQAIVKETFRLHPLAPLLVPYKAETDVKICGFTVPKNSQVLINAWDIGCDPSVWSNPNAFMPERFLGCDIDVKGRDFELIPFGAGRRICLALPLAHRMVHLILVSLLHSYAWKLDDGMKPEDMDMNEKLGFTLQKAQPLRAIPIEV
ncbi:cytochrome P450 76T24-like [Vitis vinifera]|nr:cytochrome P450 76T24-like [Vitis vinifera]